MSSPNAAWQNDWALPCTTRQWGVPVSQGCPQGAGGALRGYRRGGGGVNATNVRARQD